jgi:hypothetical protein
MARVSVSASLSGVAEWLARETSGENIDNWIESLEFSDIVKLFCVGEMMRQHLPTKRVNFDLIHVAPSYALRGKVEPSDSGEQRSVTNHDNN